MEGEIDRKGKMEVRMAGWEEGTYITITGDIPR